MRVNSGGLAVMHPALGANDLRFDPRRDRNFSSPDINFSAHNIMSGAAVSTELFKNKGGR